MPDHATDREREQARRNPERETLLLAATGAATVMGARHSATRAFARAPATMAKVDLWQARLALRTKCTSCDDRHIGSRKDALYLDQEIGECPLNRQEIEPCHGRKARSSPLTAPPS